MSFVAGELARLAEVAKARLETRHPERFPEFLEQLAAAQQEQYLAHVLATSQFVVDQLERHLPRLVELVDATWFLERSWRVDDWYQALARAADEADSEVALMKSLREFRNREMLRIIWRDFSRQADLEQTLADVSLLAEAAIRYATARAEQQLQPRYGAPVGQESGLQQELVVLAMGKLGGRELNLSSDVDLIFTYGESGNTEGGRESISNQEYFIKLGQLLIKLLDAQTADGFVFRVDMRLRPYGDSGALVGSLASLETYYQEQGREWERYAMIKVRPITGSEASVAPVANLCRAFTYRRYTDFSVLESLRDMKAMIAAETLRQPFLDDIKRGYGGIREIEFIAQSFQLIYGGRLPELQSNRLIATYHALVRYDLLQQSEADELVSAYRFLRNLEHGLQGMADRQTQTLPTESVARAQLAAIMGLTDWEILAAELLSHRSRVTSYFARLVEAAPEQQDDGGFVLTFAELSEGAFASLGFQQPAETWSFLSEWLQSPKIQYVAGESRRRLEQFLPRLCALAAEQDDPDRALLAVLPFVQSVVRRSAYLVALVENPHALAELVFLSAASPWIAEKLAARPELVDELLHKDQLYAAPERDELYQLVRQQLLRVPEDDLEGQMQALLRIKDAVVLRVAASELTGSLSADKVSDNLTFLAEVIVQQAVHIAEKELVQCHGQPQGDHVGFAVMGYGKMGGVELSYDSDLDLVFVSGTTAGETSGPRVVDNTRFYTRLAQRVVHILSTAVMGGRLYEVDLRLRPNGESGLVVISLSGFEKYQRESAWTWEHQALVRARVVAGDPILQEALAATREQILQQRREPESLASEVADMRRRMLESGSGRLQGEESEFDVKRDAGGIVDIEFVVQYLVLAHAAQYPQLTAQSHVVGILAQLALLGVLPAADADMLRDAYLALRAEVHAAGLYRRAPLADQQRFAALRAGVMAVRDKFFKGLPTLAS